MYIHYVERSHHNEKFIYTSILRNKVQLPTFIQTYCTMTTFGESRRELEFRVAGSRIISVRLGCEAIEAWPSIFNDDEWVEWTRNA